ncbi:hypothetical protein Cgig2_032484 [Carnegiea gigantea]|uniref:Uncharacterized protein n=1 Tax=Carnegiea gigantea TaxID=171969 RepID=A0A9Q1KWA1_9CARY|nr:hypothetical protein Cgig2_032484 [Carnegiea gigantea]
MRNPPNIAFLLPTFTGSISVRICRENLLNNPHEISWVQQPFPLKEVIELNDEIMKNGFDECLNQVFPFAPKIRCVLPEERRLFLHDLEASVNHLSYAQSSLCQMIMLHGDRMPFDTTIEGTPPTALLLALIASQQHRSYPTGLEGVQQSRKVQYRTFSKRDEFHWPLAISDQPNHSELEVSTSAANQVPPQCTNLYTIKPML